MIGLPFNFGLAADQLAEPDPPVSCSTFAVELLVALEGVRPGLLSVSSSDPGHPAVRGAKVRELVAEIKKTTVADPAHALDLDQLVGPDRSDWRERL